MSDFSSGRATRPRHLLAVLLMALATGASAMPFVDTAGKDPQLPTGSRLLPVSDRSLHVRSLGTDKPGTAVLLLSGPTDHWHADTGWFALLQPLLAKHYRVHAIDRAGHGFSELSPEPSYQQFADDLAVLLPQLEKQPVLVVAFASSNLALHHYFAKYGTRQLQSVLLIDPDGLHPELLSFYAEQAQMFQQADKLAEYVNAGKYDARAAQFRQQEREHLQQILPPALANQMDWPFYDAIATQRLDRARILARFAETARYDRDVMGASAVPWPATLPVWSYDTDFELSAVDSAKEPEEKAKLARWHRLSSEWMQGLPGQCRISSSSREHLATVAEADKLVTLVTQLAGGQACPATR